MLQFAIGTLVLALVLRTWLVMGLIEPVTVAGSSMVPTLCGPSITVTCEKCGNGFAVGVEFDAANAECMRCGYAENTLEGLPISRGNRLLVDRLAFQFRDPERWEPVVFLSPDDGQITVKRAVGLPGETVQLQGGDVWINGKIATKTLTVARAFRQLIHEETGRMRRWQSDAASDWHWRDEAWRIARRDGEWHWLRYQHPEGKPITADSAYNAGFSQRLFAVRDFALSTKVQATGTGKIAIRFDDGSEQFQWEENLRGEVHLEVFAFDRRVKVFVDNKLVASKTLAPDSPLVGTASPFAIAARDLEVTLDELKIYHDIYHASQNQEFGIAEPMSPVLLGKGEVFVLGDNVPVSLDSRRWGPVPLRLLVGRPLAVR